LREKASKSKFYKKVSEDMEATTYYLDGPGRLEYPILIRMYVMSGGHGPALYMVARFRDDEEWNDYEESFLAIKRKIASFNMQHGRGTITSEALDRGLEETWIPMVDAFAERYSPNMVPLDIRWGYNDVMRELGREEKVWPPKIRVRPPMPGATS
jgi:hypothetical protein